MTNIKTPLNRFSSTNQPKTKKTLIKALSRTDIGRYLLNQPLVELMKMNSDLKEFCENKFGEKVDEMTGKMAIDFSMICKLIIAPTGKDFEIVNTEVYGKRKEEPEDKKTIELPTMNDPIDLFLNMSETDFLRLAEMRKKETVPLLDTVSELVEVTG